MSFQSDLRIGRAVEVAVMSVLIDENDLWGHAIPSVGPDKKADYRLNLSLEIKFDALAETTGNIALEVACSGKPSGITCTSADYWATVILGAHDGIYLSDVSLIRHAILGKPIIRGGDRFASELVLLKVADFLPLSRRVGPAPDFLH